MPTSRSLHAQGGSGEDLPRGRPAVALGSPGPSKCLPVCDDKELCPRPACGRELELPGDSKEGHGRSQAQPERGKLKPSPVSPQPSVSPPGQGGRAGGGQRCSPCAAGGLPPAWELLQHGMGQACHELMSSAACGVSRSSCIAHDPATLPPEARRLEALVKLER